MHTQCLPFSLFFVLNSLPLSLSLYLFSITLNYLLLLIDCFFSTFILLLLPRAHSFVFLLAFIFIFTFSFHVKRLMEISLLYNGIFFCVDSGYLAIWACLLLLLLSLSTFFAIVAYFFLVFPHSFNWKLGIESIFSRFGQEKKKKEVPEENTGIQT